MNETKEEFELRELGVKLSPCLSPYPSGVNVGQSSSPLRDWENARSAAELVSNRRSPDRKKKVDFI